MIRYRLFILCALLLGAATQTALGQGRVRVSGRVFDMTKTTPMPLVSVLSTSGTGTVTDSLGRYTIIVYETDSIWFSYLNKPTPKYAVAAISNIYNFEISLHVQIMELKQVMVKPRNYKLDSIQNRQDYAKAFNFQKPGIGTSMSPSGMAGLDLGELFDVFRFRQNRRMNAFKQRLLLEEQEKFIDHRFSRALVIKLTGLHSPELDTFMIRYRPELIFIQMATDYELQWYIKSSFEKYKKYKSGASDFLKPGEQ